MAFSDRQMDIEEAREDFKIASNARLVEEVRSRLGHLAPAKLFQKIQQLEQWAEELDTKESTPCSI